MGHFEQLQEIIGLTVALVEEEELEHEEILRVVAAVIAEEIMELEEGFVLEGGEASWVHVSVNLDDYLNMGDPCFKLHFRMTKAVFETVCATVREHLVSKNRLQRERTPFIHIMLMVTWLLATPDSFRSVALRFGVVPSTLYYFYIYIIEALRELSARYICWPNEEERVVIKNTFERATGFPGVIGCIDCTHVYITAPVQDSQQYVNRHHTYSINVQAVVDNNLLVRQLHVGEAGSTNDARVFRKSDLYRDLLHRAPGIIRNVDEHLVGDGAYTLTDFMMKPFQNNGHLTGRQLAFNRSLSQCRVRVENAFGLAKAKWRRLKFMHARNPRNVVDHIAACFVLHNMVINFGEPLIDEAHLAIPIRANQILGRENFDLDEEDDLADEDEQLMAAAEGRGEEKRLMIMNDVLPNFEEEEDEV